MTASTAVLRDTGPESPASPLATFSVMIARDARVLRRDLFTVISRTVVQPLLFVFVFAYVLPKLGPGISPISVHNGGPTFATILVPGMVASTAVLGGTMTVTMHLMVELSYNREIEDRMLAPVPVWALGLEKILWGAVQGLIAGLVVFPVVLLVHAKGEAPDLRVTDWPLFVLVLICIPVLSAALGLWLGTVIDVQRINVLISLIMVPATMLGCVYYPWATLHAIRWLQILVLVNPIVYAGEALRTVLTPGVPHMPVWAFLAVLVGGSVALCLLALRSFRRRVLV